MGLADVRTQAEKLSALNKAWLLSPVMAALAYPFALHTFNVAVNSTPHQNALAAVALSIAVATPMFGLFMAWHLGHTYRTTKFTLRARRLAYASIVAPPAFVLFGVSLSMLESPIRDTTLWACVWINALLAGWFASDSEMPAARPAKGYLRVMHGAIAVALSAFLLFHLSNHLAGLGGPAAHAKVMEVGRAIYRSPWIESAFLTLLALQIAIGLQLALRWSAQPASIFRAVQIGTGIYIFAFASAHLNSALVSARLIRGIETDWAWAAGLPEGLVFDPWNIRLLPHYAYGAFCILAHLACGARQVLLAHGAREYVVNWLWWAALVGSFAIAATIIGALVGLRV